MKLIRGNYCPLAEYILYVKILVKGSAEAGHQIWRGNTLGGFRDDATNILHIIKLFLLIVKLGYLSHLSFYETSYTL